jgi:hypothetical protein
MAEHRDDPDPSRPDLSRSRLAGKIKLTSEPSVDRLMSVVSGGGRDSGRLYVLSGNPDSRPDPDPDPD